MDSQKNCILGTNIMIFRKHRSDMIQIFGKLSDLRPALTARCLGPEDPQTSCILIFQSLLGFWEFLGSGWKCWVDAVMDGGKFADSALFKLPDDPLLCREVKVQNFSEQFPHLLPVFKTNIAFCSILSDHIDSLRKAIARKSGTL